MRITFILPWAGLAGGIRVVAVYAQRLAQRGHRVTVISLPWRRTTWREWLAAKLRGRSLPVEPAGGSHLEGLDVEHRVLNHHGPVGDADVPDGEVVVATWWETAEWVARLSAGKGAKVHFIQGDDRVAYEGVSEAQVRRVEEGWGLPLAKVVVSGWLADLIRPLGNGQPVNCIVNAVDHEQFHAPVRGKQAEPTFGFVYSEARCKGCDLLVQAAAEARREYPEARFLAFGAVTPTRAAPLPGKCDFVHAPSQETIRGIYSRCDGWLFPSRREGFGLPIVEAMACRTPVIAAPAGAARELLAAGGGILVERAAAGPLAEGMRRVAAMSDERWREMSQRAYETVAGYSWDAATDAFEAALMAAARPRGSSSAATASA